MSTLRQKAEDLLEMVKLGKAIEAIEKYYADEVVMIEGDGTKRAGKATNLAYEKQFFADLVEIRDMSVTDLIVSPLNQSNDDGITIDISSIDATHSQFGEMKMRQASMMTWKNGQVIEVKFFFDAE